jgi:hypothetical protein
MDLTVKFLEENADVTLGKDGAKTVDWKPAVIAAASELKALEPSIKITPGAMQVENMIGDIMTPPNEYGYSTIRFGNVKRIVVTEEFLKGLTSCQIIIGDTTENKEIGLSKDNEVITIPVRGGDILGTKG